METRYGICILGYGQLTDLAKRVTVQLSWPDTRILVVDCTVDNLVSRVNEARSQGYEVFVGGAGNAAEFFRQVGGHLVEIRIRDVDYLRAIRESKRLGGCPVIAAYQYSRLPNVALYRELLDTQVELLTYEDGLDLYAKLERSHSDVVIGASHAVETAESLGKQGILVYPGEESLRRTIAHARSVAIDLRRESWNQAVIRSILNNSAFGIVVSDSQDNITLFNNAAQNMTGIPASRVRGAAMDQVFPALETQQFFSANAHRKDDYHLIGDTMFRCVQTKIVHRGEPLGVLTTLNTDTRSRRHRGETAPVPYRAEATFESLTTQSAAMQTLVAKAEDYADSFAPVVLLGKEGTGREKLAQCIHNRSLCAKGPYVPIHLASIGQYDAGRYLFGCEERERTTVGLLEMANHGTAVLLQLGQASPQALRCIGEVLTTHRILRLGQLEPTPVNIRFLIVATPEEWQQLPADLRYRLGSFQLQVPPLCSRREDIPALFFSVAAQEAGNQLGSRALTPHMRELLETYRWPGNLAELTAVVQRYLQALNQVSKPSAAARFHMLLEAIGEETVLQDLLDRHGLTGNSHTWPPQNLAQGVAQAKALLGYNNDQIAERLGISRTSLWRILHRENADSDPKI